MRLIRLLTLLVTAISITFSASVFAATDSVDSTAAKTTAVEQKDDASQSTVNINTADVPTLQSLNGIGAKKAQAIIDYRTQHGPFKSVQDLTNVKGLSENTLAGLLKKNPGRIVAE